MWKTFQYTFTWDIEVKKMVIKLETQAIRAIAIFEQITGVHIKDCLVTDECIYFLIEPGKVGTAVGRNGSLAKHIEKMLGKRIKIYEYADTPEGLIKNMIPNVKNININGEEITIYVAPQDKFTIIGRNGRNIKVIKAFLERCFSIKNVRLK